MAQLPDQSHSTQGLVDTPMIHSQPRPYLGMSGIGGSCTRAMWYGFHWAAIEPITSRLNRLFSRGHREEPEIIKELAKIGVICYGDQTEIVGGYGHAKGHCDGMALRVPEAPKTEHLLEFKTAADASWKKLQKLGLKEGHPVYFAQCQRYMHGLHLTRALFISVNKNNDSWYVERIAYDKGFAEDLVRKEEAIILSAEPLKKIGGPEWYECRWCGFNKICHGSSTPIKNCRTCEHCSIQDEGKWNCTIHKMDLAVGQQRIGCDQYQLMKVLLPG